MRVLLSGAVLAQGIHLCKSTNGLILLNQYLVTSNSGEKLGCKIMSLAFLSLAVIGLSSSKYFWYCHGLCTGYKFWVLVAVVEALLLANMGQGKFTFSNTLSFCKDFAHFSKRLGTQRLMISMSSFPNTKIQQIQVIRVVDNWICMLIPFESKLLIPNWETFVLKSLVYKSHWGSVLKRSSPIT